MLIPSLQLTIKPTTGLYTNIIPDLSFTASESSLEGRDGIVLDFNNGDGLYSRDVGTIFSWPISAKTALYVWQPSLIPQPENVYGRPTDWLGTEQAGAKFIQGCMVTAQSFNVAKTFRLQSSDDLSFHDLLEVPLAFNKQSQKAFSCVPFIAHSARIVSTDGVAWQVFDAQLVFQPYPEETRNWTTELASFGVGYGHVRMLNIAYIAASPLQLTLTFDEQPGIVITNQLPATATIRKQKVLVSANKGKLVGFSLTSDQKFRVFKPWIEVWYGQWGRETPYVKVQPFGGNAADGALV